jgi:D-glycero-D-manno-heptose 1,7-bisphosphate phosphatase
MLDLKKIDKTWTLFLDRDGVINHEKDADYIRNWGEFRFYKGVPEAMSVFAQKFHRILIVTNQKGIGRGLMTDYDLREIHLNMTGMIEAKGGRVDKIYYSADLDDNSPNRKPNPGMGWKARHDFPEIDFAKALMVGNTMGDMLFGKNLGTYTVFIPSTKPMPELPNPLIDAVFPDLYAIAKALQK